MKRLIAEVPISSAFSSDPAYAQNGGPFGELPGMKKLNPVRVPKAFQGDKVLISLIDQYRNDWEAFRIRSQDLRKQLGTAAKGDRAVLVEILRDLMQSNQHAQSNFMRAMRARMRELRMETEE